MLVPPLSWKSMSGWLPLSTTPVSWVRVMRLTPHSTPISNPLAIFLLEMLVALHYEFQLPETDEDGFTSMLQHKLGMWDWIMEGEQSDHSFWILSTVVKEIDCWNAVLGWLMCHVTTQAATSLPLSLLAVKLICPHTSTVALLFIFSSTPIICTPVFLAGRLMLQNFDPLPHFSKFSVSWWG